jgi:hypothetical protein
VDQNWYIEITKMSDDFAQRLRVERDERRLRELGMA